MRRRTRSLIALATAYGMMLAAVFGGVASGRAAVLGASAFCRASYPGDQAPVPPARHDLDCCIACCSGAGALPAPAAAGISVSVLTPIIWPVRAADFFCLPDGSPFARAPPSRV